MGSVQYSWQGRGSKQSAPPRADLRPACCAYRQHGSAHLQPVRKPAGTAWRPGQAFSGVPASGNLAWLLCQADGMNTHFCLTWTAHPGGQR